MKISQRKLRAEETRMRIQTAAMNLFEEYGYNNVSMQEIAERAGCSVGNLYHYYKNKDALILQFTDHVDMVYDRLMEEMPEDLKPFERLEWFVIHAIVESNGESVIAMGFAHALRNPELHTMDFKDNRPYFKYLSDLVEACKADGSIPETHETRDIVRKILIIQRGILFQWRVEEGRFDVDLLTQQMAHGLLSSFKEP